MIKVIDGLPADVVGVEAVGEVKAGDYEGTLDPAVDAALAVNDKISLLYVLGSEFDGYSGGAMWEDTKLGAAHWRSWKKIALVTDHGGYADGVKAFAWLIPAEIKVFPLAERNEATTWITG